MFSVEKKSLYPSCIVQILVTSLKITNTDEMKTPSFILE